jgi:GMP synthase (glutamine-hydrolysing)
MICIVNFGSSKTEKIGECLKTLGYSFLIIDWQEIEKVDWSKTTGIILSGAPVLLTETDSKVYIERFRFLKTSAIPVLGICFGHQLLGLLFGATIFKSDAVRSETEISVLLKSTLFVGLEGKVKMMEDHTEGISLPPSFVKFASSEKYRIEAMKHSSLNLFGVQFHPEVSGENGLRLLNNFCKLTTQN